MSKHVTRATIYDALHFTPEEIEERLKEYPEQERKARAFGVPLMGSGLVFPIDLETVKIDPFQIPDHWPRLAGLDFGWDHPTAAAEIAWDRDTDTVVVTKCYRKSREIPVIHCATLKAWGEWLPWSWPNDGRQTGKGDGMPLQNLYRKEGLKLLPVHAQFPDGGVSVEAGVMEMLEMMRTGRWKVFSTCGPWFEEAGMYHRKDGKIVKEIDDVISASRYAYVMRRFARTNTPKKVLDLTTKINLELPMDGGNARWMGR